MPAGSAISPATGFAPSLFALLTTEERLWLNEYHADVAELESAAADDRRRQLAGLRQAVAERYCERGLPTQPDEVLITTGALLEHFASEYDRCYYAGIVDERLARGSDRRAAREEVAGAHSELAEPAEPPSATLLMRSRRRCSPPSTAVRAPTPRPTRTPAAR